MQFDIKSEANKAKEEKNKGGAVEIKDRSMLYILFDSKEIIDGRKNQWIDKLILTCYYRALRITQQPRFDPGIPPD